MKIKIIILASILVVLLTLNSCLATARPYPFPANPYDNVYESIFYSDNGSWVMTSGTCPYVEGNAIVITNYWWQEFDEEGNEEWLRYYNDFYRMVIPLDRVSVEIIHITDENNTAHVVHIWEGR